MAARFIKIENGKLRDNSTKKEYCKLDWMSVETKEEEDLTCNPIKIFKDNIRDGKPIKVASGRTRYA